MPHPINPSAMQSYDWARMIDQLVSLGMSECQIGRAMQSALTRRMMEFYRKGAQPLYWRGALLVSLWCDKTGQPEGAAPVCEVTRGHRSTSRRMQVPGPRLQSLPNWPPPKEPKKPGPKPRVLQAA